MTPPPDTAPRPPEPAASARQHAVRQRINDGLLLVMLLAVATGLHTMHAPAMSRQYPTITTLSPSPERGDPLSMDETWHLTLSTGRGSPFYRFPKDRLIQGVPPLSSLHNAPPWWKIWTTLDELTHPPLYILSLRAWRAAFGESDAVAIALSCAWSCVAIVFVWLTVRLAAGRASGFWAAAILATSPTAAYFAQEVRGYAMLTALAAVALWLLTRLTINGPRTRDVIGLCVVLLACLLTHYFAVPACLAAGVYAMAIAGRHWWRVSIAGIVTAGVYAAVWLPFMLRQLRLVRAGMGYLETAADPSYKLTLMLALPLRLIGERTTWPSTALTVAACATLLAAVVWAAVRRPAVRPLAVWFFSVALALLAADVARHTLQLAHIRYSSIAQPSAVAFVPVVAVTLLRRRWVVHAASVLTIAAALKTQPYALRGDAPVFTAGPLTFAPKLMPGDVLALHYTPDRDRTEYVTEAAMLDFSHVPGCFPRDVVLMNRPADAELLSRLRGRRVWLLSYDKDFDRPAALVPGAKVLRRVEFQPAIGVAFTAHGYLLEVPAATTTAVGPSAVR